MIKRVILSLTVIGLSGNALAQDITPTCEDLALADTPCACEFMQRNLHVMETGNGVLRSETIREKGTTRITVYHSCDIDPVPGRENYVNIVFSKDTNKQRQCSSGNFGWCVYSFEEFPVENYKDYSGKTYSKERRVVGDIVDALLTD